MRTNRTKSLTLLLLFMEIILIGCSSNVVAPDTRFTQQQANQQTKESYSGPYEKAIGSNKDIQIKIEHRIPSLLTIYYRSLESMSSLPSTPSVTETPKKNPEGTINKLRIVDWEHSLRQIMSRATFKKNLCKKINGQVLAELSSDQVTIEQLEKQLLYAIRIQSANRTVEYIFDWNEKIPTINEYVDNISCGEYRISESDIQFIHGIIKEALHLK